jgi:NTP pyrophosphatase (non-canonical NTP hydrolase)
MGQIRELMAVVRNFCEVRDWDQYHGPKDLSIGIVTEASELLEIFRFLSDEQALELFGHPVKKEEIEDELADILFFLLRFAQRFDIDIDQALHKKVAKNEKRYPVELSKGKNCKYSEFKSTHNPDEPKN